MFWRDRGIDSEISERAVYFLSLSFSIFISYCQYSPTLSLIKKVPPPFT